jgi:2-octaprenyl-6-methoxyphenol hydroxylase
MRTDVLIVGGGLVGQALALALAAHEIGSIIVERGDPDTALAPEADGRVSAIASAPARMLRALGLGDVLDDHGQPIATILVGEDPRRLPLRFDAPDDEPLGIMLENRRLRAALLGKVRGAPLVRLLAPAHVATMDRDDAGVRALLDDGRTIAAPLAIAADGRHSALRAAAGIRGAAWNYRATALVGTFAHERPHAATATEIFHRSGPFAQLPMRDLPDGRHRSAMVWTAPPATAAGLMALSVRALGIEAERRFGRRLGAMELLAPASAYPLGLHHVERYWAKRLILVGDAAHVVHPVAGQGLNMGLRDVAALAEVLDGAFGIGLDPGSPEVARRYETWRRSDNFAGALATDGLIRLFGMPAGRCRCCGRREWRPSDGCRRCGGR